MIENPLYTLLSKDDVTPEAFADSLAAFPPSQLGEYGLIPMDTLGLDEYRLQAAEDALLTLTAVMPGAGFYMIESDEGVPSHRFAGGAAYTQMVLPLTADTDAQVEIELKHVFDPATAQDVLAFINGVRTNCAMRVGENGPEALQIDIPKASLISGQAAVLTLIPPGHVAIEGGARHVAFGVSAIVFRGGAA